MERTKKNAHHMNVFAKHALSHLTHRFDYAQVPNMMGSSQGGTHSNPYLQQLRQLSNWDLHTLYVDYQDLLMYDDVLAGAIEDQYYR